MAGATQEAGTLGGGRVLPFGPGSMRRTQRRIRIGTGCRRELTEQLLGEFAGFSFLSTAGVWRSSPSR